MSARKVVWPGTPRRVTSLQRRLARELRQDAKRARRNADKQDRLAGKIERDIAAGAVLRVNHVYYAIHRGSGEFTIGNLIGLYDSNGNRDDREPQESLRSYVWRKLNEFCYPAVEPTAPTLPPPPTAAPPPDASIGAADVLGQAKALARSARAEDIDWMSEPLTDREREVRRRYLDAQSDIVLGIMNLRFMFSKRPLAKDIRAAIDAADARSRQRRRERDSDEFRRIADEIDDVA